MPSSSTSARRRLALEVERSGIEMAPCSACRKAKTPEGSVRPKCIVGPKTGKCSECIRKGYSCCDATLSNPEWEKIRSLRDRLAKEVDSMDDEELALLSEQQRIADRLFAHKAKRARLRRQLRLAESRSDAAVLKEIKDLDDAAESERLAIAVAEHESGVEAVDRDFFHGVLEMPIDSWLSVSDLAPDFFGSPSIEVGNSSNL